jgi:hypothetical protein
MRPCDLVQQSLILAASGPIHDHRDPDERDTPSQQVEAIRLDSVDAPAPQNGEDDEDTPVRGVDAPEIGWLEGWDDAVKNERDRPGEGIERGSPSRSQSQTRYPPPISQSPAKAKKTIDLRISLMVPIVLDASSLCTGTVGRHPRPLTALY